ncbi:transport-associated [Burkholderia ambifaria MEX-5]|uniref:Transport-associated n=1 Tax=Burkholderia ambifaria MEX-5 TaxID=396597 RepID=B1T6H8_9BURK|nr:transport-associated [Burkholderia ambifaria MEX-5]
MPAGGRFVRARVGGVTRGRAAAVHDRPETVAASRRIRAAHGIGLRLPEALARRAQRESAGIAIDADDGIVTLTGTVASLAERRAACGAAASVRGVREVVDRLSVA